MGALEDTDWSKLLHAYGRALDTPDHLHALLEGDDDACSAAIDHLWAAINHQGSVYPATAPVARFIAEHLADARVEDIREELLAFLASIVGSVIDVDCRELVRLAKPDIGPLLDADEDSEAWADDDLVNAMYARGLLGVAEVLKHLVEPVLAMLDSDRPSVRAGASQAACSLVKAGKITKHAALTKKLRSLATAAEVDERCAHVLSLGYLGETTAEFLDDPAVAVRACAALGTASAGLERATDVLLHALEHEDIDRWFQDRPPQFSMSPRFHIIAVVLDRVKDFDRVVDAAIHVAKTTVKMRVDFEWGPLLAAAFRTSPGTITTDAQRRYLAALVENAELWDPIFGNPHSWFDDAGLPYDRQACAALLGTAAPSR